MKPESLCSRPAVAEVLGGSVRPVAEPLWAHHEPGLATAHKRRPAHADATGGGSYALLYAALHPFSGKTALAARFHGIERERRYQCDVETCRSHVTERLLIFF